MLYRMGKRSLAIDLIAAGMSISSCAVGEGAKAGPPHVILLIGDGMGYSSEVVASRYLYGNDVILAWRDFPFLAWATTWDVTTYDKHAASAPTSQPAFSEASFDPSLGYEAVAYGAEPWPLSLPEPAEELSSLTGAVTDSAASASAMATGQKTNAGRIAWSRILSGSGGAMEAPVPIDAPDQGGLPSFSRTIENPSFAGIVVTAAACKALWLGSGRSCPHYSTLSAGGSFPRSYPTDSHRRWIALLGQRSSQARIDIAFPPIIPAIALSTTSELPLPENYLITALIRRGAARIPPHPLYPRRSASPC
jgi:hypothetical protein